MVDVTIPRAYAGNCLAPSIGKLGVPHDPYSHPLESAGIGDVQGLLRIVSSCLSLTETRMGIPATWPGICLPA